MAASAASARIKGKRIAMSLKFSNFVSDNMPIL